MKELHGKVESQLDKFKAAAKDAECDLDEKSFDEALGKLAKSEKHEDEDAEGRDSNPRPPAS